MNDEPRLNKSMRRERARLAKARERGPSAWERFEKLADDNEQKRARAKEGWKAPAFIKTELAGDGKKAFKRCENCKAGRHDLCSKKLQPCICEHEGDK